MSKSPAFQFYPKDWLSSPKVQLMTPAQEGAYVRLLCYCWDSGDCSLPDDDAELAILSRLGEGWLNGGSAVVRKCFMPHPSKPGHITNTRLLEEAEKQLAWQKKSSEGGKKSAEKRAEKKESSKGGSGRAEPKAKRPLQPNGNSSSSFASSSAEKDSGTTVPSSSPFPTPLPDWIPAAMWKDYLEMRRKKNAAPTQRAKELIIKKLDDWRLKGHDPSQILEKSITSNWTDIFEPKGQQHGKHADFNKQDYYAGTEGFDVT